MLKRLIAAIGLTIVFSAHAATQTVHVTYGNCSPAVSNVTGSVTITCEGIDPEALKQLNEVIEAKYKQLVDRLRETEKMVANFQKLEARLQAIQQPTAEEKQAVRNLKQGLFEEVGQNLEAALTNEERSAEKHFNRAKSYTLQFYSVKALPHYRKAHEYDPGNMEYALELANALLQQREYIEAHKLFNLVIEVTHSKFGTYTAPDLLMRAESYTGLANIARLAKISRGKAYSENVQLRMMEYVRYQEQAVASYRHINQLTTDAHIFELANAINQLALGVIIRDYFNLTNMSALSYEAADLYERLAKEKPEKETYYLAYAMGALTQLAFMQRMDRGGSDNSPPAIKRVIALHERILAASSDYLTVEVAGSYFMISVTYFSNGEYSKAEEATTLAIEILEEHAQFGDEFYQALPQLYQLQSQLFTRRKKRDQALAAAEKSVNVARQLVSRSPKQYGPMLAGLLGLLAKTQRDLGLSDAAAVSEAEQRQITDQYGIEKNLSTQKKVTKQKTKSNSKEEVYAFHILVHSKEKALKIIEELRNSNDLENDFKEAAKKYSTGPFGKHGGELNWFKRNVMVKPFEDAAFAMHPGEISKEPVKSLHGWHVIYLKNKRNEP